jgi:molybdopterin converting factor small subunit
VTVTIDVPALLRREAGGAAEITVSAPTVRAALAELEHRHPALYRSICDETRAVRQHVGVFVGEDHIRDLSGLDTLLKPGDVVSVFPAVSGG